MSPVAAFQPDDASSNVASFDPDTPGPSPRVANILKAKGVDESAWDYPLAIVKGLAHVAGIPTRVPKTPLELLEDAHVPGIPNIYGAAKEGYDLVKGEIDAYHGVKTAAQEGSTPRVIQQATRMVPMVGEPLAAAAEPGITYSEGKAPTHEQNVQAVEGWTELAAMAALPKVMEKASAARVKNILRSKGIVEPEPAAAPTKAEPADLSDSQVDRLVKAARPGNPAAEAQVPSKLREALASGKVSGDEASVRRFLGKNPDVAAEVKASYDLPTEEPLDEEIMAAAARRGNRAPTEASLAAEQQRFSPEAAIERENLPIEEFIRQRFPRATLNEDATPEWSAAVIARAPEGKPGLSIEEPPAILKDQGVDRHIVYRDPEGKPVAVATVIEDDAGQPLGVRQFATDKSQGLLASKAAGVVAGEIERMGIRDHVREISPDAARLIQKAEARNARRLLGETPSPKGDKGGGSGTPSGAAGGTLPPGGDAAPPTPPAPAAAAEPPLETHVEAMNPLPGVDEVVAASKRLGPVKEFMDAIAPASASEGAASAADILRKSKGEVSNDATIEQRRYRPASRLEEALRGFVGKPLDAARRVGTTFARASDSENVANISEYERTGQFRDVPPAYSEMYRESTDAAHAIRKEVYGDDRVGFVENYVQRLYKFGTTADAARSTGVLSNWVGSLSAETSGIKARALAMPLDAALKVMRDAGLDVSPVTTNPELLRQYTVANANQARVYKQAWEEAKSGDLIQFVKQGARIPQGMVELNDRVAKIFRPTEQGMVQTGRYFAEPGVARVFNNAISKGLGGSPTFRSIRAINNAYNQVQLGLSAFHLTGTAINAGISDLSLGLQQLINGEPTAAAKSIGRAAVPGYSFVRDMFKGREFINDLVADDPEARAILADKFNPAGARLGVEQSYRNAAVENMQRAWANRRYIRALGNAPLAVVQKIASPLMDYAIPRVKIGAFLDLADAMRGRLGADATPTQIQRAYEQAWDSIDNRFGQLVHDNLFWNRTAADLAQVSTRSVGWNLGTIREIGGGAVDLAKGNLSQRTLYSFSLPLYAGTIGAVYMYLHTGKMPQSARDYFYPENGLKDKRGNPDRVALPTYMKDVSAYSTHPVVTLEHKASPLLSLAFDLGTNRDYFGDMIRNPEETRSKQLLQMGTYAMKQFQPFSIQQAAKTAEEGGPIMAGEQLFGFVKAPAEMRLDPAQSEAMRNARRLRYQNIMRANARRHR